MKTKKDFLSNNNNPELAKKVFNQLGTTWKELCENINDYRDAGNGISGFIYYSETISFTKRNIHLILKALNDFENECGNLKKPIDDHDTYYNWLAWFALENTINDVMSYLEY